LRDIPGRPNPAAKPILDSPDDLSPPRISELFEKLRTMAGGSVIFSQSKDAGRVTPPASVPSSSRSRRSRSAANDACARVVDGMRRLSKLEPARLAQISGPLDQFLGGGGQGAKRLAIAEAVTSDHYLLFALLVSHVLDDGGTFLVVAPDDLLPNVKSSLNDALSRCGVGFAISDFEIVGHAPPESGLVNLVFVPEGFLHTGLLNNSEHYSGFLERLRLVFLMEVADMDLSWLRLRLLSLWQVANYQSTRIVMQSSSSVRLNEIIGLVATEGGTGEPIPIALTSASTHATHVLMFDDTEDLRTAMTYGVRHAVSAPVMLALESQMHDCPPILYKTNLDPADVVQVESNWRSEVTRLMQVHDDSADARRAEALAAINRTLFRSHLLSSDAPATVIAWDTYNFLAVKDRNYNYFRAKDFLVQILSKPYPMRDFLLASSEDPEGFDWSEREIFLPHAPRLAGGVAELAFLVVEAMRRGKGLTRSQFKEILATVTKGQFLQSAGIGNDASGIERLLGLQRVAGRPPVEDDVDRLTGERVFKLAGNIASLRTPTQVIQNGQRVESADLDYADRGLTFGLHTRVRVRNRIRGDRSRIWADRIWGVQRIEPNTIYLETPPGEAASVPNYVFVNSYKFNSTTPTIVESTEIGRQLMRYVGRAVLHVSFSRTTEQYHEYESETLPFAGDYALHPVEGRPWTRVDRNLKCVAHLVLTNLSSVEPVGSSPPGLPPISKQLAKAAVALATCTIIKDTIASLFPDAAPRIAVLSNQLGPMSQLLDERRKELEGVLTSNSERDRLERQIQLANFLAGRVGFLREPEAGLLDTWQSDFPGGVADRDDILEIFVVEDSEWDLGVARAVVENDNVLKAAAKFCASVVNDEDTGGEGSYLRFGAEINRSFVYLAGADRVLSLLAHAASRSSPASTEEPAA
jgi:hypothetical protein